MTRVETLGAEAALGFLGAVERLLDGRLRQGRHDPEAGRVGMQSILRQVAFQKSLFIDHGVEVVQIDEPAFIAVILQPAVQLQNLFGRALQK